MADLTKMPTPPARTAPVLHPAAQEAAAAYSEALMKASKMEIELRECRVSFDAASRHIAYLEKQLADCEFNRRALERYAVEITTHLDGIGTAIATAKQKSMTLAKQQPPETPPAVVEDMERAIAEAVDARKDNP